MKKIILLTVILLMVMVTPCWADDSQENVKSWLSIGGKDNYRSLAFGYSLSDHFGLEFGLMVNTSDYENIASYPYSDDYTIAEKNYKDFAAGIDLLWYPFKQKNLYIGTGIYMIKEKDIVQLSASSSTYNDSTLSGYHDSSKYGVSSETWVMPFSAGYQFKVGNYDLGIGYHTIRGYNLQLGLMF